MLGCLSKTLSQHEKFRNGLQQGRARWLSGEALVKHVTPARVQSPDDTCAGSVLGSGKVNNVKSVMAKDKSLGCMSSFISLE